MVIFLPVQRYTLLSELSAFGLDEISTFQFSVIFPPPFSLPTYTQLPNLSAVLFEIAPPFIVNSPLSKHTPPPSLDALFEIVAPLFIVNFAVLFKNTPPS